MIFCDRCKRCLDLARPIDTRTYESLSLDSHSSDMVTPGGGSASPVPSVELHRLEQVP